METINGFAIIAAKVMPGDVRLILGVRPYDNVVSGFEYVVAATDARVSEPDHWVHGDYSWDLHVALARFDERG